MKKIIQAWAVRGKGNVLPYGSIVGTYTIYTGKPVVNDYYEIVPVRLILAGKVARGKIKKQKGHNLR